MKRLPYVWLFSFYFTFLFRFMNLRVINDNFRNFGKSKRVLTFFFEF